MDANFAKFMKMVKIDGSDVWKQHETKSKIKFKSEIKGRGPAWFTIHFDSLLIRFDIDS